MPNMSLSASALSGINFRISRKIEDASRIEELTDFVRSCGGTVTTSQHPPDTKVITHKQSRDPNMSPRQLLKLIQDSSIKAKDSPAAKFSFAGLKLSFAQGMRALLRSIRTAEYTISDSFPNPLLDIAGVGTIGLPVSRRDVDSVICASHGNEDSEPVPRPGSVFLAADEVHIRNPAWQKHITKHLVERLAHMNFSDGEVRSVDLVNVVFATTDATEVVHKQHPTKFGLSIDLPSRRTGSSKLMEWGSYWHSLTERSDSELQSVTSMWRPGATVTFFPDEGLQSGHICTLLYDVDVSIKAETLAASPAERIEIKLWAVMNTWRISRAACEAVPDILVFTLERCRAEKVPEFGLLSMKTEFILDSLHGVFKDAGLGLSLAIMEREVPGGYRIDRHNKTHRLDEQFKCQFRLKDIALIRGAPYNGRKHINLCELVDPEEFLDDQECKNFDSEDKNGEVEEEDPYTRRRSIISRWTRRQRFLVLVMTTEQVDARPQEKQVGEAGNPDAAPRSPPQAVQTTIMQPSGPRAPVEVIAIQSSDDKAGSGKIDGAAFVKAEQEFMASRAARNAIVEGGEKSSRPLSSRDQNVPSKRPADQEWAKHPTGPSKKAKTIGVDG